MKTTEIVSYRIKSTHLETYPDIITVTDVFLANQPGFISRRVLQDAKDESLFTDVVEWESLAEAEFAGAKVQSEPSLLPFLEATEKIISFNHYQQF